MRSIPDLRCVLGAVILAAGLGFAPAPRAADGPVSHAGVAKGAAAGGLAAGAASAAANELVLRSLALIGVRYRRGGSSPETGLDCSGLVQHVFREAFGLPLPRRSEEMSREGSSVSRDRLQPGDLVFFNTLRRAFSHVGIYIGENRFVHAPSSGGRVRVEAMDSRYWARRFNGARRLAAGAPAPVMAMDAPAALQPTDAGRARAIEQGAMRPALAATAPSPAFEALYAY